MLAVVAPVDHRKPVPALEVRVTFPPTQKVVGPLADMAGAGGNAFTVTAVADDTAL